MSFMQQSNNNHINATGSSNTLGDILPTLQSLSVADQATAMAGRVLVTSGSGVIAYRVAMSLLEAGHPMVRVGIYSGKEDRGDEGCGPQCAEALRAKGAEVVDFDWTNEGDFSPALKDVTTVFCTIPHAAGWQDVFPKFVRKCMYKNVQHFVKVSFLKPGKAGATSPNNNNGHHQHSRANSNTKAFNDMATQYRDRVPFCAFHGACDDYLLQVARQDDNPMTCTILGSGHLMTSPLFLQGSGLRKEHTFVTASYSMGVNYVSPNDVADAAVVVILNRNSPQHANHIYNITGPEPTTDAHVAKLLTASFGCPIEHISLGYHEYVERIKKRGLPAWQVKDSAAMERMKAMGYDELSTSYTKDLEKLTGKKAESFASFLKTQSSSMRPGMAFVS